MKVILNVSENWYRTYAVEIPDGTPEDTWEALACIAYMEWLRKGAPMDGKVQQLDEPQYIDDAHSDTFFIEGKYDE